MELTHPDLVLYPEMGATKRDLGAYYASVADLILPHIARRPLALLRCPEGHGQQCFFQRHHTESTDALIRRVELTEASGERATSMAIDDLAGLLRLVQMGTLEIHTWGCRIDNLERPDRAVVDLDPGEGVAWSAIVEAALQVRSALAKHGLRSFVKTSGGKGLHVVVPLERRAGWEQVRSFTEGLVRRMAQERPDLYVSTPATAKRKGRIFLDCLRNVRGATTVAPYSLRARAGAPISTPTSWKELNDVPSAQAFTLANIAGRVERGATAAWRGFFDVRQSITRAMLQATAEQ